MCFTSFSVECSGILELTTNPMNSWKSPKKQNPIAVEKLDTMSTFRGMCSPSAKVLKVALAWRTPPIVQPRSIVMRMFAMRDPKFSKNRKLIPTAKHTIRTFLSLKMTVKTLRHLLSSDCSIPNLWHVTFSYIIIFPKKQEPNIDANSNNIVMYPELF